jgi:hypothetical protein
MLGDSRRNSEEGRQRSDIEVLERVPDTYISPMTRVTTVITPFIVGNITFTALAELHILLCPSQDQ